MEVCVVGTGYVGLVTGTCLAYLGHSVVCVDIDERKIETLRKGRSPIYEPGLDQLIANGLQRGNLRFSTDLSKPVNESEIIFIAVGTPPLPSGKADLSYVKSVAQSIGRALDCERRRVIVNKSTVPIGSGNWVEMLVKEGLSENPAWLDKLASAASAPTADLTAPRRSNGGRAEDIFLVASNPEFLREGAAISDTFYPDRIVIGAADGYAAEKLRALYEPIVEQTFTPPASAPRPADVTVIPVVTTDLASAEMIKYAANAFLATKISFANEIANVCERVGADIKEVVRGFGLDSRIGPKFLNAGVGWGGSCFGKDVSALIDIAREYGYEPALLHSTVDVNKRQRRIPVQKLQEALKIIKGKTIGLLGLAFKPDTDDLRDAPSIEIVSELIDKGARVKAYDPIANEACRRLRPELKIEYAANVMALAEDCDAIVIVTEWEEFRYLDLNQIGEVMNAKVLIDGRNVLDPEAVEAAGFKYRGIGR
ncbi:MAG TPA: UDP-glucose/GDP-mannose dehydrogenase family protein [Blastocatellia bacterium]|nr:UDP-glucose/GDP-mannose dehydrogenase family protein [Blastocatellia bacterium]